MIELFYWKEMERRARAAQASRQRSHRADADQEASLCSMIFQCPKFGSRSVQTVCPFPGARRAIICNSLLLRVKTAA
jgi:hypothetical protein